MPRALVLLVIVVTCLVPLHAQGSRNKKDVEFSARKQKVLAVCGQRHLEYGLDLRKKGLATQAAAQIVLAAEVAEGNNYGASYVLSLMRSFDDAFWKKKIEKPGEKKIEAYEKKARQMREEDLLDRLEFARWAWQEDLLEAALDEFKTLLRERDEPLEFDAKGALVLGKGSIPAAAATRIMAEAITINGKPYVRDAFLEKIPELTTIFEACSEGLRVRATTSEADALAIHALAEQLLPELAADFGSAPDRRLQLVLFGERKLYDTYLVAAELLAHRAADGLADNSSFVAIVCMEGKDEQTRQAIALHELTHLAQFAVSPAVLPSWYVEGFAELYGGEGTFTWDGKDLTTRGELAHRRIESLRGEGKLLPLKDLLDGEALSILSLDAEEGHRFYAQAWAFVAFLRTGADPGISARFAQWEQQCLGSAIGADLAQKNGRDRSASRELFQSMFADDLDRLEVEFEAWLAHL